MPIKFTMTEKNHGLDTTAKPVWLMVPENGMRKVTVHGANGHMLLRATLSAAGVAKAGFTFREQGEGGIRTLEIQGTRPGLGAIDYHDTTFGDGPESTRLLIAVKPRREVKAVFHYVDDGNAQATRRKPSDLEKLLKAVNAILGPQANVWVVKKETKALKVPRDLGSHVIERKGYKGPDQSLREWSYLIGLGDNTVELNVYFVRLYERDTGDGRDTEASAKIRGPKKIKAGKTGHMIMEDIVRNDADTFAHEILHHLGLRHADALEDDNLNASGSVRDGQFIPGKLVDKINPTRKPVKMVDPFAGSTP